MVKRSDLAQFLKVELQPLLEKMNLGEAPKRSVVLGYPYRQLRKLLAD